MDVQFIKEIKEFKTTNINPEPFLTDVYRKESEALFKDNEIDGVLRLTDGMAIELRNNYLFYFNEMRTDAAENERVVDFTKIIDPVNLNSFESKSKLLKCLSEFPEEWTIIQLNTSYNPLKHLNVFLNKNDPGISITKYYCGQLVNKCEPYCIPLESCELNILNELEELIKYRSGNSKMSVKTLSKIFSNCSDSNVLIMNIINNCEKYLLGGWKCLLSGNFKDNKINELITEETVCMLEEFFIQHEQVDIQPDKATIDIVIQLIKNSHCLTTFEIKSVLIEALTRTKKIDYVKKHLNQLVENIKRKSICKDFMFKLSERSPIILILDHELEIIPWESLSVLSDHMACRMPSLHCLYASYKLHAKYFTGGYRVIEINSGYSLLNPSNDLKSCQRVVGDFLNKEIKWLKLDVGIKPHNLLQELTSSDIYLYFGHGCGSQYVDNDTLRKTHMESILFLFGCSSNIPKNTGGYTPVQNITHTYITNGCPVVVGFLWSVSSTPVDETCLEIMKMFLPKQTGEVIEEPKESNMLKVLTVCKQRCSRAWERAALVIRGLPCRIQIGKNLK